MTGKQIYDLYAEEMAKLPYSVTKGEALPSWVFIPEELAAAWNALGSRVVLSAKGAKK